jgi:hypothetical protein
VVRNVHAQEGSVLLQPRWAMSFMRGPMTRNEIRMARELLSAGPRPHGKRMLQGAAEIGDVNRGG